MALLLFSPKCYPKFFDTTGRLNVTGDLSMLFGISSLWCLSVTAITSLPFMIETVGVDRWKRGQRLGYVSLLIFGGHVFVLGLTGWFNPPGRHGYLPPVSLVAFSAVLFVMLLRLAKHRPQ
jgi:DMSO/TMAO reductase YedYZ heme-binding membrane subunit